MNQITQALIYYATIVIPELFELTNTWTTDSKNFDGSSMVQIIIWVDNINKNKQQNSIAQERTKSNILFQNRFQGILTFLTLN